MALVTAATPPVTLPEAPVGTCLWLVRHAEVEESVQGKAYGSLDVGLSARGELDTEAMANALAELEFASVTSSPLVRAHRLAARLAELREIPHHVDEAFREIDRGRWQSQWVKDLPTDEVREFYRDPWLYAGHGGESDRDLAHRLVDGLTRFFARHAGSGSRQAVLVVHYNVIRVLISLSLGASTVHSFAWRIDPAHAALLMRTELGWSLAATNVTRPRALGHGLMREVF